MERRSSPPLSIGTLVTLRPSCLILVTGILLVGIGCAPTDCDDCDRLVIVAIGEPSSLFPPLVLETVGRDISDRMFERLAYLPAGASPLDPAAYQPVLAARWENVAEDRWRFHLRQNVTWHDGQPFTADDVRFSFEMFQDPTVDALARGAIDGIVPEVIDQHTIDLVFPSIHPEQLYDATYHVRIVPEHLWGNMTPEEWMADTDVSRIVGTGPYRLESWTRPTAVRLVAADMNGHSPGIGELVWSFQQDPDAASNLLLSGEVDAMETVPPPRRGEVEAEASLTLMPYPSAVYGFLAFNLDPEGHTPLTSREVRRALVQALDRPAIAVATVGPGTSVPRGPMSELSWINDDAIAQLPFDSGGAVSQLEAAGWIRGGGGWQREGSTLQFDVLVPSTSHSRMLLAQALQESWRRIDVAVTITSVDFPVFIERLRARSFDSYIGAFLDEPSARAIADQWTRAGWDQGNYGHYANPAFDSLANAANGRFDAAEAKALWIEALSLLNGDAPAVFLFTPVNVAAVSSEISSVEIDPYSWLESVAQWSR